MLTTKILLIETIILIIGTGTSYRELTTQIADSEFNQPGKYANYLKTGNFKVTAVVDSPRGDTESWVNNINDCSYYISNGQLVRIDAASTGTSILFLESGTYLLDNVEKTYSLFTDEMFYPEILSDIERNNLEISQIYNIFSKSIEWTKYAYYTWESGEPPLASNLFTNTDEIKKLKIRMFISETEPLIEKIILTNENNVKHDVSLKYEVMSNDEVLNLRAVNFSMYRAERL